MLTAIQQRAIDRFAKSLSALSDDSLIDAYHQAWEATETAMRDRFPDHQSRYKARYP